jgi:hypothetical protein
VSYDLLFRPRGNRLSRVSFREYFTSRRSYTFRETQEGAHAAYENEDTGVYFSFVWGDGCGPSMRVNYVRPHVFGLESEREVTAFVTSFEPAIDDPQSEGMGQGPYTPEGYLRGWNAGNVSACRAFSSALEGASDDRACRRRWPAATLERMWRWNFHRWRTQDVFSTIEMEPWFVPRIVLLDDSKELRSAVVWSPRVMILVPEVDAVLVPAAAGSPSRIVGLAELGSVLTKHSRHPAARRVKLGTEEWPLGIDAWGVHWEGEDPPTEIQRALATRGRPFEGRRLQWDQVLTEEALDPRHA